MHGEGKMTYQNGEIYVGKMNKGLKHGDGIFTL